MQKATIEYCVDGYNTIVIPITSMEEMDENLQKIKSSEAVAPYTLEPTHRYLQLT